MDIVNHLRIHLFAASTALVGSMWALRLLQNGTVTTLGGGLGIAGLLFGSSMYAGLVFGMGGGWAVLTINETIDDYVHQLRTRRQRVVERFMADGNR